MNLYGSRELVSSIRTVRARLRGEIVFRCEVAIKATMRQPRSFHDVGHPNSVKTMFTKQGAGNLNDSFAVRRRLFSRHSYRCNPPDQTIPARHYSHDIHHEYIYIYDYHNE